MCLVVSGVSTLIHLYSVSYLAADRGYRRFFAYLNFFVFSMLLLVLAGTSCCSSSAGRSSARPPTC